jgi:hypothetical protein
MLSLPEMGRSIRRREKRSGPRVPGRYVPKSLSKRDKIKQTKGLLRSRLAYKRGKYVNREHIRSFRSRPSGHVEKAKRIYGVDKIGATTELAKKTHCSRSALKEIIRKGEGAFYSSGSRPNQTAQSWGIARLASSITHGPAARIDSSILKRGCSSSSPVF